MSDVQLYLIEVDKDKAEAVRIAQQSAQRLEKKELKLIDLITSLEEYINNRDDGNQRAKSVAYLAEVLSSLSPKALSFQEKRLLSDFILGRIEGDLEGIGASARALVALETLGKWDSETAQKVLKTFLDHTHPVRQFKLQTERYAIVQLVDLLLAKYRDAIHKMQEEDPEFMPVFISYFEGEKDPRNLMLVFSLLQVPMTEWDIQANAQDLFESVFNYFPITFKPPPDDPYGITAQDLKDRLRDCIASNSDFAPHAFPQLLDKLDSTSMNTKRDVLQAIQACVIGYEPRTINLYAVTLWDALKFEILNVQEEDLAVESLKALALIAAKMVECGENQLNAYIRPIIKECNEHLEDAPTKQSEAAGKILYAVAASSPPVADRITKGILPALFALFQGSESIVRRRGLLEVFNEITKAYSDLEESFPDLNTEALQAFSTDALDAMLRGFVNAPTAEVSFRLTSLDGLAQLAKLRKVLSDSDIHRVVDAITDVVLHEKIKGHGDIRSNAIKTLTEMAGTVPDAVRDRALPAFMVELPDVPADPSACDSVLEAFAELSSEQRIFDTVVLRLKNKLNAAKHQKAPEKYQRSLLLALLYTFKFGSPRQENGKIQSEYYTDFAEPLVADIRQGLGNVAPSILEITGRICNVVLRSQGAHFQATVYNKDLEWIPSAINASQGAQNQAFTSFVLYYYAALRPEVADAADIVSQLKMQAAVAVNPSAGRNGGSLRLIALLLNKFANPKVMQSTLEACSIEVSALLSNNATPQAINLAFAVVKALITQGKSGALSTRYLDLLLQLLANGSENAVAQQFATILAPDDILTRENHCFVSGLAKQKVFNQAVPHIIEAVRNTTISSTAPTSKSNYLIALSGILRWLPYSILEPSLSSLSPALLQTLDLTSRADDIAKAPTLAIFESALMHDPNVVQEHTASLVTRLLNCCASVQIPNGAKAGIAAANTAPVRAKALLCLALMPRQLKREAVVPYRRQVVKRLLPCLDDPKRAVRMEAVRCRTAWLGLDKGADDEE
ncbi:MMS19 nucleotide excision repair protein-like protein [Acrodontium crateriforme]|uniref:MMS19 nucleotide excision repair protein n=1 Tax=Acrodontium crateriforme TaxID=150365 RepID=A0AAQ3M2H7_9PEZI|nr:MMS19 nucleotide excision repair protein-like protein [Acrodontium crateriforme]